jgi:hypothetical protein
MLGGMNVATRENIASAMKRVLKKFDLALKHNTPEVFGDIIGEYQNFSL